MSSMDYILASNWLMQDDNNNNNTPIVKKEPPNDDSPRDTISFGRKLVEQQHEDQQQPEEEEDNNDDNGVGLQIFGGGGGDAHDNDGMDDGKKEVKEEEDEEDSSEDEEDMDTEPTKPADDDDDASNGQWIPMLDYLCSVNGGCSLKELQVLFTNLESRRWMLDQLRQSRIVATHLKTAADAAGSEQQEHLLEVRCDDLTAQNANVVYAFRGYLSITVRQYYFARHGVVLRHPYLPCLIEYGGVVRRSMSSCSSNGVGRFERHASFFPLEVLAVFVPSSQQPACGGNGHNKHIILPSQRGLYK